MTLTLRDIPIDLDAALRRKADEQHRPLDEVAVEAMKAGLGLATRERVPEENASLAAAIRARFAPFGGLELADPIREPMPEPLDLGE